MQTDANMASVSNVEFHLLLPGDEFTACYKSLTNDIEEFWPLDENMFGRLADLCMQVIGNKKRAVLSVLELYHVDSTYRSAYYAYYSRRHFDVPRYTVRLSFFDAKSLFGIEEVEPFEDDMDSASFTNRAMTFDALDWISMPTSRLQRCYLGSTVLCPTRQSHLGRTLLSPSCMVTLPDGSTAERAMIRLSTFELNIAGKKLRVRAFPFHDQDHDLMSCAEVTILNLMKYYANEYHGYKDVEPADILDVERQTAYSRLVPTTGLSYTDLCAVLKEYGFQPELYESSELGARWQRPLAEGTNFRRLLHTYIESGIPTAINVAPHGDSFTGHSLICVGRTGSITGLEDAKREGTVVDLVSYPSAREDADTKIEQMNIGQSDISCRVIHAADLQREYVVIDDNQLPYAIRDIDHLSVHEGMENARLVAPLKMGMTVDANDAQTLFEKLMSDTSQGLLRWAARWFSELDLEAGGDGQAEISVVMRTFLASSKRFKTYRVATVGATCGPERAQAYMSTPLPHYVWVCEFLLASEYEKFAHAPVLDAEKRQKLDELDDSELRGLPQAFCEYVVDATSGPTNVSAGTLVMSHFPYHLGVRMPNSLQPELSEWPIIPDAKEKARMKRFCGFPCFMENWDVVKID